MPLGFSIMADPELIVTYDPLKEFLAHYADAKSAKSETVSYAGMTVEEKLKQRIIDGDKLGLDDDLREALITYSALEIVNDILLGGMKVVGDLFGAGEMQLPFVLQSAETMKAAVKFLEPFMEKLEGDAERSKGVMVLATVKGDVHDIGKNLVDIILTNNGYRVVNLGIKVALEPMLEAVQREHADALGMSGLLVKSTAIMKENLEVMQSRNLRIPVVLGGAALTRKFVEKDLRALYSGTLSYAQDAFDGLHFMEDLKAPRPTPAGSGEKEWLSIADAISAIKAQREKTMAVLEAIDEKDYHIAKSFNRWSLRDVVAHMIAWEQLTLDRNEWIKQGVQPDIIASEDLDRINEEFVRRYDVRSKRELLDLYQQTTKRLIASLETLTEAQYVNDVGPLPSVQKRLPGCVFDHERHHVEKIEAWLAERDEELDNATGAESKIVMASRVLPWLRHPKQTTDAAEKSIELEAMEEEIAEFPIAVRKVEMAEGTEKLVRTSATPHDNPVPTPPFWGSRVVNDIKIEKVWEYLNEVALFRGQWQMKRGKKSPEAFAQQIEDVARPKLQEVKLRAKRDKVLVPKVVYGYFPCWSEGEDVVILRPAGSDEAALFDRWDRPAALHDLVEWRRFTFPRQPTARRLCLSDFFLPREEAERRRQPDVIAFTAVTVGREASRYTKQLFESNQYADYLYMHGLSVETAEALAEYWHKIVRTELGIADKDAPDITRLFSQGYQGSRYSFGYPACPNLEDQTKLFELLRPERIDISLTEEFHLEPEQSTTAIVVHHPSAKYFSIK